MQKRHLAPDEHPHFHAEHTAVSQNPLAWSGFDWFTCLSLSSTSATAVNQSTINVSWTDNSQGNHAYVVRVYNLSGQLLKEDRILAGNLTKHTVKITAQTSVRIDVLAAAQWVVSGPPNYQAIYSNPATTTVNMPGPTSLPTVSISGVNMTEATGGGSFTLVRTGSTTSSLAVQLYEPFGTAQPGVDFTAPGPSS